jgi:hypothetical protein
MQLQKQTGISPAVVLASAASCEHTSMSDAKVLGSCAIENSQTIFNWLLQLPAPGLRLVLQKLDCCSLISTAATCRDFNHAAPASLSRLEGTCSRQETLDSLILWLERHRVDLTNLKQFSVTQHGGEP